MKISREMANRFSNGDNNLVEIKFCNIYPFEIKGFVIDELPFQFQIRDFKRYFRLKSGEEHIEKYYLRPVVRGKYQFGNVNILISTTLGLISKRFVGQRAREVAVYPSFHQLKKMELMSFSDAKSHFGIKRIRKSGNNMDFDQIKDYVLGDEYRKINWRATAKYLKLMVNHYQDERSQNIYQVIDMGRTMKMPFEGMTLLDYSINSALALTNIVLKKEDRAGLITYSNKLHTWLPADNKRNQLTIVLENLYAQDTLFKESNLEEVYLKSCRQAGGRSLFIIYTNFESEIGLERQLPILRKMASQHLVLLVSFVNTEVEELIKSKVESTKDIYLKALAEDNLVKRDKFMGALPKYGIINMLVRPQELTISVLNKYLEIKRRGII